MALYAMTNIDTKFKYAYLEGIGYSDELLIKLAEGIVSSDETEVEIYEGKSISGNAIEITEESKRLEIRFDDVFSFHVMQESYGGLENYEQTMFQFLEKAHASENVECYEIYTEDVIITVLSSSEPALRRF